VPSSNALLQKVVDRFNRSRFFTISLIVHVLLIAIFGGTVLFKAIQEPPDFEGGEGGFVAQQASTAPPPTAPQPQTQTQFQVTTPPTNSNPIQAITTMNTAVPLDFTMNQVIAPPTNTPVTVDAQTAAPAPTIPGSMSAQDAAGIRSMTEGWGGKGKGTGSGTGVRQREFEFIAYIGKYSGGNWDSTVRLSKGQIEAGSLPNLLFWISKISQDKIKTNERNVKAIDLASDELFSQKPPFIFLTGSRDFKLTDKEVENLRNYVRMGGCIWGDSSVPGRRSAFDIAFRREMRRIIPDVDKNFETLPGDHPIFTKAYFSEIKTVPPGLNYYQEPVYALKIFGQIAILYTSNDYADMWQIGLDGKSEIDFGRDRSGRYVAINDMLWRYNKTYTNNLALEPIVDSYKFGLNVVTHLLTRWEDQLKRAPRL